MSDPDPAVHSFPPSGRETNSTEFAGTVHQAAFATPHTDNTGPVNGAASNGVDADASERSGFPAQRLHDTTSATAQEQGTLNTQNVQMTAVDENADKKHLEDVVAPARTIDAIIELVRSKA